MSKLVSRAIRWLSFRLLHLANWLNPDALPCLVEAWRRSQEEGASQ